METFEQANKKSLEVKEKASQYHFDEMAEIEPAVLEVVKQLKENIEKGEYDALISDDAGGRIPTLILGKIFKKINPDKPIRTLFVAAGHSLPYRPDYDERDYPYVERIETPENEELKKQETLDYQKLLEYLRQFKEKNAVAKALIITQFIFRGATIDGLLGALHNVGLEADVAALEVVFVDELECHLPLGTKIYYAPRASLKRKGNHLTIAESHEGLSGVEKQTKGPYSPTPIPTRLRKSPLFDYSKYLTLIEKYYGRMDVAPSQLDSIKEQKIAEEMDRPLTPKEAEEIQKNINLAREDIDLLAENVVDQVWKTDV